jgi:sugar-specific transcriptional regulator TrmB
MGLHDAEARLYQLLVSKGPCTVGFISPLAGLSRTKAYSVLDRMVRDGYAILVTDRPRTYAAVHPKRLIERRTEDFGSATEVIRSELFPVYSTQNSSDMQMNLKGVAVLRRAEDMLRKAKREIIIVGSFLPREVGSRMTSTLKEMHARGVNIKTVVSEAIAEEGKLGFLKGLIDLRVTNVPNAGVLIVDDEEVLIGSMEEDATGDAYSRLRGIWSRDLELVKLQRMLFDRLYSQGAV